MWSDPRSQFVHDAPRPVRQRLLNVARGARAGGSSGRAERLGVAAPARQRGRAGERVLEVKDGSLT